MRTTRSWRIRPLVLALVLAASLAAGSRRADATAGAFLPADALVRMSEVIVRGTVVRTETTWSPDHRAIWTLTTVHVSRYFKGSGADTIVVRTLGGTMGSIRAGVAGEPNFIAGQDVMLFLHPRGSLYGLTGMAQGVYYLSSNAGTVTASRNLSGLTFVEPSGAAAPIVAESPISATDLEASIARLVGGAR